MQDKNNKKSPGPFKAKLRHYHRSASPELYARRNRRWEDVSASEFPDASLPKKKFSPKLSIKLKTSNEENPLED
ncbi:MAG: hypothetical protein AB8F34_01695 [Akkermansiaceae bacterium]